MADSGSGFDIVISDDSFLLADDTGVVSGSDSHSEVQLVSCPALEEKMDFLVAVSVLLVVALGVLCGLVCCSIFSKYIYS